MAKKPRHVERVKNLVVISDTHCGCRLGLLHPHGIHVDSGGVYLPSEFQQKMWNYWREFWEDRKSVV